MVAMLLYAAAKLADLIKWKADSLLPERQVLFASIAEEANVKVIFSEFHDQHSCSLDGCQGDAEWRIRCTYRKPSADPWRCTPSPLKVNSPRLAVCARGGYTLLTRTIPIIGIAMPDHSPPIAHVSL